MNLNDYDVKIGIIGLGYVGLPLAIEFSKIFPVIGFDIDKARIEELQSGLDVSFEVNEKDLISSKMQFSNKLDDLRECSIYIVTVPTPIDNYNKPDLRPLFLASKNLGELISK